MQAQSELMTFIRLHPRHFQWKCLTGYVGARGLPATIFDPKTDKYIIFVYLSRARPGVNGALLASQGKPERTASCARTATPTANLPRPGSISPSIEPAQAAVTLVGS